jgi:hypothetical protein
MQKKNCGECPVNVLEKIFAAGIRTSIRERKSLIGTLRCAARATKLQE